MGNRNNRFYMLTPTIVVNKLQAHRAWLDGNPRGQKTPPIFSEYLVGMEEWYQRYGFVPNKDVYLPSPLLEKKENSRLANAFNARLRYKGQRARVSKQPVVSRPQLVDQQGRPVAPDLARAYEDAKARIAARKRKGCP